MKKIILIILACSIKIFIPLTSTIISLILVDKINIFKILNLIKDEDKLFDICLSFYILLITITLQGILDSLKSKFFTIQTLQVTLSKDKELVHDNSTIDLHIRDTKVVKAKITISIKAKKKTCEGLKLIIDTVSFITIQLPLTESNAKVDQNGNLIIDIEKLFGNQSYSNTTQTFNILMLKECTDEVDCKSELYPRLNKEPFWLTFDTNKAIVRTGD